MFKWNENSTQGSINGVRGNKGFSSSGGEREGNCGLFLKYRMTEIKRV